uniref:Uncharacterized protein n=1 Tax=Ciona intestinalis TaxID=7719 RepID=H2XMK1_CIOIN
KYIKYLLISPSESSLSDGLSSLWLGSVLFVGVGNLKH